MGIYHWYRKPGLAPDATLNKLQLLRKVTTLVSLLETEICYNIEIKDEFVSEDDLLKIKWILGSAFDDGALSTKPNMIAVQGKSLLIEIGPRLNFSTAFSSNATSICKTIGLGSVVRLEMSIRYLLHWHTMGLILSPATEEKIINTLHDRMTQCCYKTPIMSFELDHTIEPWYEVDILGQGRMALEQTNKDLGLGFDSWDLDFYTSLFGERVLRNPTSVECFDLAQSNSEHSRHWFFKGEMIIDGKKQEQSLLDMIIDTQHYSNPNNVIKFSDNSSAIEGFLVSHLTPGDTSEASKYLVTKSLTHLIFTAETHNFPTGVSPFSGATTGTGGRLRDIQGVGRGGNYIAGTAGYSVGNLLIPGYIQPWEDLNQSYPSNFATPLNVLIEASNGASDYGNKFGEPLITGFVRSYGQTDLSGERREWIKPIMFSGGMGTMDARMSAKMPPKKGMSVVKVGGPVYRIGVGGGAASSIQVQGDNKTDLDLNAVQRGDAEMEQKLNRVIRACVERGDGNPICSIHDQGAGGNGNVLKEIVEPAGAVIFTKSFQLGDPTISTLELWGAEYQENDALLCLHEDQELLLKIGKREKCPVNIVGIVLDSGKIILSEEDQNVSKYLDGSYESDEVKLPVNLHLDHVLGKMPQKVFVLDRKPIIVKALTLPMNLRIMEALERVLHLPSVASKRYLTSKVDRCVTGLLARQQCCGPLHTPIADVAVTAISFFDTVGIASSIGEQPIKGLINASAGARMSVGEALSNLVFAKISHLKDVKCSGNWMWAAKLPGEGATLYEACKAMCVCMKQLGIAIDGGKDSLSMAARVGSDTVKAPGALVVSTYAPCPDITKVLTPDLKCPSNGCNGSLLLVDLSNNHTRLGGSALAQCYNQLGDDVADLDDVEQFSRAFVITQSLIQDGKVSSGHDCSDGGIITCLLEMSFTGISGLDVKLNHKSSGIDALEVLFAEDLGWILEVQDENREYVEALFHEHNVPCWYIGQSKGYGMNAKVLVCVNGQPVLESDVITLFNMWEECSSRLELLQTNPVCVEQEYKHLKDRKAPQYHLTFDPYLQDTFHLSNGSLLVAVVREEGSNGDREMAAALHKAGFQVWDINMQDLLDEQSNLTLDRFKGIVFPGGFSYADVLGSAKGWAASLLFHPLLKKQFAAFYERQDTFSLGVCNGCQLMCLLGWVGSQLSEDEVPQTVLDHNLSGRFECRWSTVKILKSNAIMLKGMDGSALGIWVAHGEGRFTFRNAKVLPLLEATGCIAMKYVDDDGNPTNRYPFNPNGSPDGLAAMCSDDGRHLAMMPHPERCVEMWQWPWTPNNFPSKADNDMKKHSPWQQLFQNAYVWCNEQ